MEVYGTKIKRILFSFIFIMTMLINGVAFAQINAYCQTDGIDTLFIRDILQWKNLKDRAVFEIQRTFAKNQEYALLRITLEGSTSEKNDIKSVKITIDKEKILNIQEASNVRHDNMPLGVSQKWYQFSDGDLEAITTGKNCDVEIETTSGKILNKKLESEFISDLQQLLILKRENWRFSKVEYYAQPTYQIFIPGATAKQVADAITYYANRDERDKIVSYSGYYRIARNDDRKIMLIRHDVEDLVYVEMEDGKNGCWLNASWLMYDKDRGRSYNGLGSFSNIVNSNHEDFSFFKYRRAWWMLKFNKMYSVLAGKYNYGMGVREDKVLASPLRSRNAQYSKGPFVIYSLNKDLFPQLAEVNLGDTIVNINGVNTNEMYLANFDKMTEYADDNKDITFVIKNSAGQEKKISITPIFELSHEIVPDYVEINKKVSFQYLRSDPQKWSPYNVFDSFAPFSDRCLAKKQW